MTSNDDTFHNRWRDQRLEVIGYPIRYLFVLIIPTFLRVSSKSHLLMVPSSVSHGSLRRNLALLHAVLAVITDETPALWIERKKPMKKSLAAYTAAVALVALAMFAPTTASAQVNIYVGPGGYGHYGGYGYGYPHYGYGYGAYPRYGYGYYGGYPGYYGGYWGHGRRVARRVWRRHERWGW